MGKSSKSLRLKKGKAKMSSLTYGCFFISGDGLNLFLHRTLVTEAKEEKKLNF